jgi:prepilin-type N-terminal cleavage/methylation domain-containing protein
MNADSRRNPKGQASRSARHASGASRRPGFSLMEVMLVLAVVGVLLSLSAPSFRRSVQQSRADIAGANLRAIWTAQRVYWLEYRSYADQLSQLESAGLLDPTIPSATDPYQYEISTVSTDTFEARANRAGSERWSGFFAIDEDGDMWGNISASGEENIVPGFL